MRSRAHKTIGLRSFAVLSSIAAGLAISGGVANATPLVAPDGITYTLTAPSLSGSTEEFTLVISGINGVNDTSGGRYGFDALAFTKPNNYSGASVVNPPTGFTTLGGGLSSGGCDSHGNFFCFSGFEGTPGVALPADSSLTISFNVSVSSGDFTAWVPDLKIDWLGSSQNNYDLVSLPITPGTGPTPPNPPPVQVPEPSTLALLGGFLMLLFGIRHLKKA